MTARRRVTALAAGAVMLCLTAACTSTAAGLDGSHNGAAAQVPGDSLAAAGTQEAQRPLVVEAPRASGAAWLDAAADPRTPQGAARARHLPRWTPDLDGAFPPAVCGSSWELDAIAEPAHDIDIGAYGDPAAMAALAVMRYEHLLSRAMAAPSALAQLCVAVASVDPARREALADIAPLIDRAPAPGADTSGADLPVVLDLLEAPCAPEDRREGRGTGASAAASVDCVTSIPTTVLVIALGPSAGLAAACIPAQPPSGDPATTEADPGDPEPSGALPAVLRAYELVPARGIEDAVIDISYRVARTSERPAADCSSMAAWAAEWDRQVHEWLAEGQVWQPMSTAVTLEQLCGARDEPDVGECPADWGAP
ncbi:hypothetical protein [Candidatus Poriferisodalis sp.]|uniref:hypothetical protein n=1 Tax=Candidatus Poriferisodalis sp. TaxID=3101277 RepID=UPI003B029D9F